ncbi:MAG: hypothetical protein V9G20_11845 [Candidatus Promineifilaceae bacterium]
MSWWPCELSADRLMLRKAHAAALLRWRDHTLPPLPPPKIVNLQS